MFQVSCLKVQAQRTWLTIIDNQRNLLHLLTSEVGTGRRFSALQRDCLLSGDYPTRQRGFSEPLEATDPNRKFGAAVARTCQR